MPLQQTSGNVTADAYGGGVAAIPNYIEDVFSTYLYTGNSAAQGISNGIALGSAYGGSGYFTGSSSDLTVPDNAALELGSSNFTIEGWVNYSALPSSGSLYSLGGKWGAQGVWSYLATFRNNGGTYQLTFFYSTDGSSVSSVGVNWTPSISTWYHLAFVRSGSNFYFFVNGTQVGSTQSISGTFANTSVVGSVGSASSGGGHYTNGYISNYRLVNGTAVYTSNFTPSTTPLTAISGTALLTCQANGFVDASSNAFTITNNSAISVTNYGPFTSSTAGSGGMVWIKSRSAATNHALADSTMNLAAFDCLIPNATNAKAGNGDLNAFNSNGFSLGYYAGSGNTSGTTYASWTFRKQSKFFDVVTYTGDGTNSRYISHSLGSAPGCMMIKATSTTSSWYVYHRAVALPTDTYLELNSTSASISASNMFNGTNDVRFRVNDYSGTNTNGVTYVCYLFAHNAGGFGLTGTDNVISCGGFTANSSGDATISLGYEPQWLLCKLANGVDDWIIVDNMRGWTATGGGNALRPNLSNAEAANYVSWNPNSTGWYNYNAGGFVSNGQYIYIAIRRGPMKVPTDATKVFSPNTFTASQGTAITTGFPVDLQWHAYRSVVFKKEVWDRLRGVSTVASSPNVNYLQTNGTNAEDIGNGTQYWNNTGYQVSADAATTSNNLIYSFRRAPSYFDEVCYTGTGSAQNITHNLGVAPEMMIVKSRNAVSTWIVYAAPLGNTYSLSLNQTTAQSGPSSANWNSTTPTSTQFSLGAGTNVNGNGNTFVAYLFATCAGVSKVGSYTGNGTTQTINCGFGAGGARFVLIKRTDATGDWYVYDTARGMTTLTDPYLLLNSTAAETATLGSVTTVSTGFAVNASILAAINTNAATYIYLAIA
jgi:hypothetical protein